MNEIIKNLKCFSIDVKLVVYIPIINPKEYSQDISNKGLIK
jgi:hypothetical protein